MSGALGAHNVDGSAAQVTQTRQWFKVSGDALQPRNGKLQLSITDEYWESYFIDQYELLAVDHPAGTEVFVDERVAVPAAPLKTFVTGPLHAFSKASQEPVERGANWQRAFRRADAACERASRQEAVLDSGGIAASVG